MVRPWEARVAEYVNSPRLTERIKIGNILACRVLGNHGVYATRANLRSVKDSSCTCPYEGFPCKHIEALRKTYRAQPRSFLNVDHQLKKLARKDKKELLEVIEGMILEAPSVLSVLGIKRFQKRDDGDGTGDLSAFEV